MPGTISAIDAVLSGQSPWHVECCDAMDGLRSLPDCSIHCAVTSPPFWGLRDYGLEPSIWGGDSTCKHEFSPTVRPGGSGDGQSGRRDNLGGHRRGLQPGFCRCNAWRGCFGLEPTPDLFVEHARLIFAEVRRVLRDDGTLWLNLGDSYCGDSKWGGSSSNKNEAQHGYPRPSGPGRSGLKQGDLCNMPHRVAEALRADGWYWRSTIIWAKRSPMPESVAGWRWVRHQVKVASNQPKKVGTYSEVSARYRHSSGGVSTLGGAEWTDCPGCKKCEANDGLILRRGSWRPTTTHECIFLFAKRDRYFGDGEAVREACVSDGGASFGNVDRQGQAHDGLAQARNVTRDDRERFIAQGRNMRGVWTLSSEPYKKAHFATFPTEVPRRCILAATSERGYCAKCGEPWAPVVAVSYENPGNRSTNGPRSAERNHAEFGTAGYDVRLERSSSVVDWRSTCSCDCHETTSAIVLEPFAGSGTTGQVARQLGRRFIGFERNPEYAGMARARIMNRGAARGVEPAAGQGSLF